VRKYSPAVRAGGFTVVGPLKEAFSQPLKAKATSTAKATKSPKRAYSRNCQILGIIPAEPRACPLDSLFPPEVVCFQNWYSPQYVGETAALRSPTWRLPLGQLKRVAHFDERVKSEKFM
jgi:hypothetical protein